MAQKKSIPGKQKINSDKLAVVTGGTGFIGSHLVRLLLQKKMPVRVVLRPGTSPSSVPEGTEISIGDIRDKNALEKAFAGASVVFHVAGLTAPYGPRQQFLEINLDGTAAVMEACVKARAGRLVHVSSMVVLGIERDRRGLTEDEPYATEFMSAYEESKVKSEQLVRKRAQETGLPVAILRPGMGWGPGERVVLPALVSAMKSPFFFMVGSGRNTLDLSYAENIAHALWLAGTKKEAIGRIYNVCDGYSITCRKYITTIAASVGLPVPRLRLPLGLVQFLMHAVLPPEPEPKDITRPSHGHLLRMCALFRDSEPDTSRIRRELGYEPQVNFEKGIAETIAWYKKTFG